MLKKLLITDIIIQFILILTAIFFLIYFKETDRASLVFYLGLGGYQLITHYIKLYYLKLKNEVRVEFYNKAIKLVLVSAAVVLIFILLGYFEVLAELPFTVFIVWGSLMLIAGPILAIINVVISIEEAKGV